MTLMQPDMRGVLGQECNFFLAQVMCVEKLSKINGVDNCTKE